jgi:REP element-mobilizing transposase RayT
LLRFVWLEADAWLVGRYVLMPDHLHLFCSPRRPTVNLHRWVHFWKSNFTRRHAKPSHQWQRLHWDRRLRDTESYASKWNYVRNNPVRAGLAAHPDDWPYQGELHPFSWHR